MNDVHQGRLFVGAHPDPAAVVAGGFSLLVLTAHQHQDSAPFPVRVVAEPLTDDAFEIVKGDEQRAERAASAAAAELKAGGKVLVTCSAGQNRSAWVAAWAMVMLGMPGKKAVEHVQARRPESLYNWFFKTHLEALS